MNHIFVTQMVKQEYLVAVGDEIQVFDFEERRWYKGEVKAILVNGDVTIACEDGLEWNEKPSELQDSKAYKFKLK